MLHLDEGILSALLDGELSGAEQRDVEAHLRGCAECRDRLAELRSVMQEADQLVTALDEVPLKAAPVQPVRRRSTYRAVAWAASIVLAVGLGFAGRSLFLDQNAMRLTGETGSMSQKASPVSDAPVPAAAPSTPTVQGGVVVGTASPERPRSDEQREAAAAESDQVARDAERRPGLNDSLVKDRISADSIGLRRQLAVTLAEPAARGFNEAAASAGAPSRVAVESLSDSNGRQEGLAQSKVSDLDEVALRTRDNKETEPQAPPAARLQPRDEISSYSQLLGRVVAREISMDEAVRVLGGSIRLVDSLTPARVELAGADSTVRVVYLTAGVEVWLDQRRDRSQDARAMFRAVPAEGKLAGAYNQLYWNDLRGFYLTLTGPLPMAELELLRARIH